MQVGDIVNKHCPTMGATKSADDPRAIPGKVVYIHPERRYYTLEFDLSQNVGCNGLNIRQNRKFRESFYFGNRAVDI